ncbi:hypothetical protein PA598K_04369 [Paenibacillus sp. 598K]|uniref:glycosyltransferase family protein n=1 Tax=Paenibacillus sp. 598K TaxID=1117987 RepID=UPI000FF94C5B|nr:glycosyltransferase [Paenibacillus sp. 598K]GBF75934.1 hypothetical protein PA598K_04369 [Paenibacillus sp. 598K]
MEPLRLLVLGRDDSRYLVQASHYFMQELAKETELRISHDSGDIQEIIDAMDFEPEFVYFHDYYEIESHQVTGLKELNIPYAVRLHDLHFEIEKRRQLLKNDGVRHVFTYYRDRFLDWFPEYASGMIWNPHHVNTDVFYDRGLERDIDILLTGAMFSNIYPLRIHYLNRFWGRPGFQYVPHPGYIQITEGESHPHIGENYSKILNRAKICVTCDSVFKYPVMKYFEITASNSLLLAPSSQELNDLGFVTGEHFVEVDETNFEDKVNYYLEHEDERLRIAQSGMQMVHERHNTKKRVKEFVAVLNRITSRG